MLIKQTIEMTEFERMIAENSNNQFLQAISYITVGSVFLYAGTSIPENFMVCDGRALDTTEYAQLFNIIGYKFGGSNDVFKLPNLSAPQVSNCNYIIKTNDSISKKDFRFPIDYFYNPKSENAQSGKAISNELSNYPKYESDVEWIFDGGNSSGNVELEIIIDDKMSDTSENPVMNKAIKSYVDRAVDFVIEQGTSNGWTYEKWASGKAVCWGEFEKITEAPSDVNDALVISVQLPFEFKSRIPAFITGAHNAWGFLPWYDNAYSSNSESTRVAAVAYPRTNGIQANSRVSIVIEARGTWK